jgi:hypothetical protein
MSISLPTWVAAIIFVLSAVDTYLLAQTSVTFSPGIALALGAANVAFAALLGFPKTAVMAVRRIRGKPTPPPSPMPPQ